MREIEVRDFHRRVIRNGEPEFTGLRAAAAAVTGDSSGAAFGDWVSWQKIAGDASRTSFGDWGTWQKLTPDTTRASFGDWGVWSKVR